MPDHHAPSMDSSLTELLLAEGPLTRLDLQRKLGVSRPTLSAAVNRMLGRGALAECGTAAYGPGRNGRPQTLLAPNRSAGAAVGIELGRTQLAVTVLAVDGTVLAQESARTEIHVPLQRKLEEALEHIKVLAASGHISPRKVVGVGVGVTGRHPVPAAAGELSPEDPDDVDLSAVRKLIPAPVTWDNNTRMSAVRYLAGTSPATSDLGILFVVLSSGVSAGVLEQGRVFRGAGAAGELGHVCIESGGELCSCGSRGCLEAYVGVDAVVKSALRRGLAVSSVEELAAHIEARAPAALHLARDVGSYLGIGLSAAAMMLDPRGIVVTGPLATWGDAFISSAEAELSARRKAIGLASPRILVAASSEGDSSHGAALRVLQRWGASYLVEGHFSS
jgi:predicted NBD/HSP70 family sugar kinase